MQSRAGSCAYVGDTFSRDVIGPQNAGFGMTFHIHSFLTASKDADVPPDVRATYSIGDIYQVYEILRDLRTAERSPQTCAGAAEKMKPDRGPPKAVPSACRKSLFDKLSRFSELPKSSENL